MHGPTFAILAYLSLFVVSSFAKAGSTTWEEQALRLQNVSATFLDAYPVGEPVRANIGVEGKSIISLLPKTNPKIGGKSENVPSSPIHTVPTLQGNFSTPNFGLMGVGAQLWAGYLPSGLEGLIGLKAKMHQSIYGVALLPQLNLQAFNLYLSLGYQQATAEVKGAITAADASDKFNTSTKFTYGALGARIPMLGIWGNVMIGSKDTTSRFEIPADATNIELRDTLSDSSFGYVTQYSIGIWSLNGFQFGFSEVFVPKRLMMPRVLLSYQFAFGKN